MLFLHPAFKQHLPVDRKFKIDTGPTKFIYTYTDLHACTHHVCEH